MYCNWYWDWRQWPSFWSVSNRRPTPSVATAAAAATAVCSAAAAMAAAVAAAATAACSTVMVVRAATLLPAVKSIRTAAAKPRKRSLAVVKRSRAVARAAATAAVDVTAVTAVAATVVVRAAVEAAAAIPAAVHAKPQSTKVRPLLHQRKKRARRKKRGHKPLAR